MKLSTLFFVGLSIAMLMPTANLPGADDKEKEQQGKKNQNQQRQNQGQGRGQGQGQGQGAGNQNPYNQGQGRQGQGPVPGGQGQGQGQNQGRQGGQGQGNQGGQNQGGQGVGRGQGGKEQVEKNVGPGGRGQGDKGIGQDGKGKDEKVAAPGGRGQGNPGGKGPEVGQGDKGKGQGEKNIGQGNGPNNLTPPGNDKKGRGDIVKETPRPALKEVKKSNGETERLAPSGMVREKTKVDQKTGARQTERIAATGRLESKEVENRDGSKQVTHYDLGREKRAEVVRKDGSKEVTDVHYNRDGKERSRETVTTDAKNKVVSKTVVKNVTINKTVIKTEHKYVVGRYGYVYHPVVVRPVLFVNPYWYTPAGVVIVHPFHYSWGFYSDPWYGFHAHYWEPYPVYYTPSYWVTDWMVAGYVADSYAISTSVAQTREEARLAREDAAAARAAAEKAQDAAERAEAAAAQSAAEARAARAETRAAKAEVEEEKRKELAGKPNLKATPIDKETKGALQNQIAKTIDEKKKQSGDENSPPDVSLALADPEHIYPVSKKIACVRADDDEQAGFLTPGDLLKLKKGQEIPKNLSENDLLTMVVMTSKGDEDSIPAGTKVKVAVKDLQEFDNEFRAKLDVGLAEAGKNQDAFKSGAI